MKYLTRAVKKVWVWPNGFLALPILFFISGYKNYSFYPMLSAAVVSLVLWFFLTIHCQRTKKQGE